MAEITTILRQVYLQYGEPMFANTPVLKNLIQDLSLDESDTNLLIRAIDCGVAIQVMDNVPAPNNSTQIDIIVNHLVSNLMWSEDKAIQAVEYFTYAKFGDRSTSEASSNITIEEFPEHLLLAEEGDVVVQYNVGNCYEQGLTSNPYKAFHWYLRAAEQGYVLAQFIVAQCYEHGKGIEQNKLKAFHWYSTAAEEGYVDAQRMIGPCYEHGIGVEKNLTEAFNRYLQLALNYYLLAAQQGYAKAQYKVGCYYSNAKADKKSLTKIIKPSKKSDTPSSPPTKKITPNYTEALHWYMQAASQGNEDAQKVIDSICAKGF
ncbi:tetratricopeptide repeat protein [Candidatus Epulonipiscium viviparus]|uniref:tetratricopeptide repeat protein n=1 Tax=Candidatus Epulonipiscium viviparus TaxID=420336 RepID=UPI00273809FE|nr:tetratricopeptide repeat protein [Candidatus Epulopiscium viviparus]